jgi:hypothetical protein
MRGKIKKLMVGLTAAGALAVGGASLASAANNSTPAGPPVASAPGAGDSATEAPSTSEASAPNDGPGGHADDAANATIDNQFQGVQ